MTLPTHPGPIVALTSGRASRHFARHLRTLIARHDDTAWLHPAPTRERDNLAALSGATLSAIGAVGLSTPRTVGERHLLRPAVHLLHGPVQHLVIHDAGVLGVETLTELHQTALITRTQLWLVMDLNDTPRQATPGRIDRTDLAEWVAGTCATMSTEATLDIWGKRAVATPGCHMPTLGWWTEPLDQSRPLPEPCTAHTRIECLLAWARRGLTTGHTTPTLVRNRLTEYTQHADITIDDMWARTAAGRDFYTHGMTALGHLHTDAQDVTLAQVSPHGATVTVHGERLIVPEMHRLPLARLRTSRRLAGCLDHERVGGVFHQMPGPNRRHRR